MTALGRLRPRHYNITHNCDKRKFSRIQYPSAAPNTQSGQHYAFKTCIWEKTNILSTRGNISYINNSVCESTHHNVAAGPDPHKVVQKTEYTTNNWCKLTLYSCTTNTRWQRRQPRSRLCSALLQPQRCVQHSTGNLAAFGLFDCSLGMTQVLPVTLVLSGSRSALSVHSKAGTFAQ